MAVSTVHDQIAVTVQLTRISCGSCGGTYAINERFREQCAVAGNRGWVCPYCEKKWGYFDNYENKRLKAQLAETERREAAAKARAYMLQQSRDDAWKEAKTARTVQKRTQTILKKTRDRAHHGVCLHCHRTFKQLAAHMKAKHPEKLKHE